MSERILGAPAGIYRITGQQATRLRAAAEAAGLPCRALTFHLGDDKAAIMHEFAAGLRLPDWFGDNYDALYDCLTDPETRSAPLVLLLSGLSAEAAEFPILTTVLAAAAEDCRARPSPLWILIEGEAPGLPALPAT